jgi:hypothetical protein
MEIAGKISRADIKAMARDLILPYRGKKAMSIIPPLLNV